MYITNDASLRGSPGHVLFYSHFSIVMPSILSYTIWKYRRCYNTKKIVIGHLFMYIVILKLQGRGKE